MKKQIVVIGLGRFGLSLARTLGALGHEVLALDKDEKNVQNVAQQVTNAVQADVTSESVLKTLGINNFDIAIVAIGVEIQSNILATILLKKLGVPWVIARANDELHGSILEKIGADSVIYLEDEMGSRVAHLATLTGVSDYLSIAPGYGIAELKAPPALLDKSLADAGLVYQGEWEVAVLLMRRGEEVIVNPGRFEKIQAEDILILTGSDEKIEKLLISLSPEKKE
jgi:trk system potassium uptake protein TrkA